MSTIIEFVISSHEINAELMDKLGLTFSIGDTSVMFECIIKRLRECYCNTYSCYRLGNLLVEPREYIQVNTEESIRSLLEDHNKYEISFATEPEILTYMLDKKLLTLVHLPPDALLHSNSYSLLLSNAKTVMEKCDMKVYSIVFIITNSETQIQEVEMLKVYKN